MQVEGVTAEEFDRRLRNELAGTKSQRPDFSNPALEHPIVRLFLANGVEDRSWVAKKGASRASSEATVLKDLLQPIMHLVFLRLVDIDRCGVAAAQLRLVLAGELSLTEWNKAEEVFGAEQGWRSFAARCDPAGWLVAETYTDE
eukprot:2567277-Alexandrium_andersonii.AAC.1